MISAQRKASVLYPKLSDCSLIAVVTFKKFLLGEKDTKVLKSKF